MKLFNPAAGVNPDILDKIENERLGSHDLISIVYHDFVCNSGNPTQEPMFCEVRILYIPGSWLLERDSLELYLTSFQSSRLNELDIVVNMIHQDIRRQISPQLLIVQARRDVRGQVLPIVQKCQSPNPIYERILRTVDGTLSNNVITLRPFNLVNKCPTLHKPNVGKLFISYCMGDDPIDQDEVARYLATFWNTELYYEDCVHDWREYLVEQYHPKYIEVIGVFNQRGGTSMIVYANNDSNDRDPDLRRYANWIYEIDGCNNGHW
jgi:NADPH-dependent 7-cyano-7-deazaguanine reductase QueF